MTMPAASQSDPDVELARMARSGSFSAFEDLVTRHEAAVFAFAQMQCGDSHEAKDATQETFVSAWQHLGTWKENSPSFKSWLFAIARRKCIDRFRKASRFSNSPVPELADEDTPAELASRRDERAMLWATARSILHSATYECLWLRYGQDMDIDEIAQVQGKSKTHVKVLLFRARLLLARKFKSLPAPSPDPVTCRLGPAVKESAVV